MWQLPDNPPWLMYLSVWVCFPSTVLLLCPWTLLWEPDHSGVKPVRFFCYQALYFVGVSLGSEPSGFFSCVMGPFNLYLSKVKIQLFPETETSLDGPSESTEMKDSASLFMSWSDDLQSDESLLHTFLSWSFCVYRRLLFMFYTSLKILSSCLIMVWTQLL